jgi:hypothetical protein
MHIPTWRVALTGGAITILAVAGIGFAAAANGPATPPAQPATAEATAATEATAAPKASGRPDRPFAGERPAKGDGLRAARLLRLGRHLVHAEATITGRDGELIVLQLDHGTVASIGGGSLTIAEAGGGSETVSTDDKTIVYVGRKDGELSDVTAGAEVFVQSRIEGSNVLAKRILVIPANT